MVDLQAALWLSAGLFCLGIVGVMLRRNAVSVFLSLELMLCSAIVALASFDLIHQQALAESASVSGRGFAVMILSLAAAQAFVGLALLIAKHRGTSARWRGVAPW